MTTRYRCVRCRKIACPCGSIRCPYCNGWPSAGLDAPSRDGGSHDFCDRCLNEIETREAIWQGRFEKRAPHVRIPEHVLQYMAEQDGVS